MNKGSRLKFLSINSLTTVFSSPLHYGMFETSFAAQFVSMFSDPDPVSMKLAKMIT